MTIHSDLFHSPHRKENTKDGSEWIKPSFNRKSGSLDVYKNLGASSNPPRYFLNSFANLSPDLKKNIGLEPINSNINIEENGNLARIVERQNRVLDKLQNSLIYRKDQAKIIKTDQIDDESKIIKNKQNRLKGKLHDPGW